jgi:hypothetical protein
LAAILLMAAMIASDEVLLRGGAGWLRSAGGLERLAFLEFVWDGLASVGTNPGSVSAQLAEVMLLSKMRDHVTMP